LRHAQRQGDTDEGWYWGIVEDLDVFTCPDRRFRIKPKGKVKMWLWINFDCDDSGNPVITDFFMPEDQAKINFAECKIKKAEWTEITVDE